MDEAAIVATLAKKIERPAEVAPAQVQEVRPQPPTMTTPADYQTDLGAIKLVDYFAVPKEARDRSTMDKLNSIFGWVSKLIKSADSVDVMNKIREYEQMLGTQFRQGDRLEALYRYLKLDMERRAIEKEMML